MPSYLADSSLKLQYYVHLLPEAAMVPVVPPCVGPFDDTSSMETQTDDSSQQKSEDEQVERDQLDDVSMGST